jgi:phosphoribosylglycinamide formyltransferase 2
MKIKLMILGAGELGKEFAISAKRLGFPVVAVDHYKNAPAMQVSDAYEVINMLDPQELDAVVKKHKPTHIIPEVEAIRTEKLQEFEAQEIVVVPTAQATYLTMNRWEIRELAARKLGLKTAPYALADSSLQLKEKALKLKLPCVVKPIMSSSGKGQSILYKPEDAQKCWEYATKGMRGDQALVIIEEFIEFDREITLLTVKQKKGKTLFVKPIGHRQVKGDYRESWIPAEVSAPLLTEAQKMAETITNYLGGAGIFGVEFFLKNNEVIFSELSPRPHDTGMVTLISQDLSEFDLHLRAILGLPIPKIEYFSKASASAVILADRNAKEFDFRGIEKALSIPDTQLRLFGKPQTRPDRRMGVSLARGENIVDAIEKAKLAASRITIEFQS